MANSGRNSFGLTLQAGLGAALGQSCWIVMDTAETLGTRLAATVTVAFGG